MVSDAKSRVSALCARFGVKKDALITKLSSGVQSARMANGSRSFRGVVRCGRVWRGQRKEEMPCRDDSISIFASKGKGQIGNALSPFHVDVPRELMSWATVDGKRNGDMLPLPQKLELAWQAAKVSKDEDWKSYFERRARIYAKRVPKRRYIEKGVAIAGACFGEECLVQYIQSRVFYCTAYEQATSKLPEMQLLHALVDDGFNLLILGPDGYPMDETAEDVRKAYADPSVPFGHERVLVAMLRGERPWAEAPRCWQE